jgi:hypothetical protein
LRAKILQVDQWVRHTQHHVVEIHLEASFARLADAALANPKSTWAGIAQVDADSSPALCRRPQPGHVQGRADFRSYPD